MGVYKDINLFAREAFFGLVAAAVPRFRGYSYGRWQRAFARLGVSHLEPVLPHLWQSTFVAGCHPSGPGLVAGIALGGQVQHPPPREAGPYTRRKCNVLYLPYHHA